MSTEQDFWSRRRAKVAAEAETVARKTAQAERTAQEQALEDKPDAEILAELGLQDPDEMQAGDDFSAFLKAAVPERIRRRALRKLWLSNPVLANVDGLLDYGEDFTDSAMVVENMQTAYQVGKGMLKHVEEMARQDALKAARAEAPPDEDLAPETATQTAAAADPHHAPEDTTFVEEAAPDTVVTLQTLAPDPDVADAAPPVRRRLRFSTET